MKTFHKEGQRITLLPANKHYHPIIPHQELHIDGVVTAVVRKYY